MIKIIADKQTKLYELTYLLPVDFTDSQLTAASENISKLITKYKGKIIRTDAWGKKELAYKIKHQGKFYFEAVYTHQTIKFSPDKVQAFEQELLLEETLLRHLMVVSENQDEKTIEANDV
jgi:small subunit ribosomal protein S6